MIVVAIIAAVLAVVMPRIDNRNNELKATIRRFTVLSRQLHSLAKLHNATYRLTLDLKTGLESEEEHTYWVEKSTQRILTSEANSVAAKDEDKRDEDEDEKAKANPGGFAPDPKVLKEPKLLRGGLKFAEVEIAHLEKPVTTGKVYIYFYPEGRMDEAAVHLQVDAKTKWTIAFHPLTAKAEVTTEYVSLKTIREQ